MAITHAAVKVSHEILYATEWNAAHQIDDLTIEMVKLVQEVQDLINGALQKAGGTMTGNIVMGEYRVTSTAVPFDDDTLTRRGWVFDRVNERLALTGGTLSGVLSILMENPGLTLWDTLFDLSLQLVVSGGTTYIYTDADVLQLLATDHIETTVPVLLPGAPTDDLHASTKKYVDDGLGGKLDSPLAVTTSDDLGPYGTGERALDTIYQNTTGKPLYVTIMVTIGLAYYLVALFIGPSSPPTLNVDRFIAGFEADGGAVKILVPTNWYYYLEATAGGEQNIDAWIEQTLG